MYVPSHVLPLPQVCDKSQVGMLRQVLAQVTPPSQVTWLPHVGPEPSQVDAHVNDNSHVTYPEHV